MSINVLIVDDSTTIRMMIKKILSISLPNIDSIIEASDGIEALARLADHNIDIMMVDINMPKMDGVKLISRIKSSPKYADIPVIVISTEGSEERINELKNLGIKDFIRKPFKPEKLREVISGILEIENETVRANTEGCDF